MKKREKKLRLEQAKQEREAAEALQHERDREAAKEAAKEAALARKAAELEKRQALEQSKLEREQQQKEAAEALQRERERKAAEKAATARKAAEREKQRNFEREKQQAEEAATLQRKAEAAEKAALARVAAERERAKLEREKKETKALERKRHQGLAGNSKRASLFSSPQAIELAKNEFDVLKIIQIMKGNLENEEVQRNSCHLLGRFALRNPDNQFKIVGLGCIGLVIAAMRQHSTSESVQAQGACALMCFSCAPCNQVTAVQLGGIACILTAMRQFSANKEMRITGCAALWYLTNDDEGKDIIVQKTGIECILAIMLKYVTCDETHCWFLPKLVQLWPCWTGRVCSCIPSQW
jgi:hypothetical protein